MKPAPFVYRRATTINQAVELMAEFGSEARLLAGGQSLIPLMNFRLAKPAALIDINPLNELVYVIQEDETLRVGAMVRQRQVERDPLVKSLCPLIGTATSYVAHPQIRNRGTLGGSLAHADPSAEYPAVTIALHSQFVLRGPHGDRKIAANDFFLGPFTTALAQGEMLVEIQLPTWPNATAFMEVARREGDFAIAGVAVALRIDHGRVEQAGIGLAGVGPTTLRAEAAEQILLGSQPSSNLFQAVAQATVRDVNWRTDVHASASYRQSVTETLTIRALEAAAGIGTEAT